MRWFLFTLFVVFSVSATSTEADSEKNKSTYLVGVEDVDYFPFFTKEDNASPPGLMIDFLNQFAKKEGIKFEYVYLPIARFPDWYESANIDFRIPDNPHWSVETKALTFSKSIVKLHTDFITLRDNQQRSIDDFRTIGTVKGFSPSPQWEKRIKAQKVSFIYDGSIKVLLLLLKRGLVDGLDINIAVARHYGRELGLSNDDFVVYKQKTNTSLDYHLSTIRYPEVIDNLNHYIDNHQAEILALKTRYQIALE